VLLVALGLTDGTVRIVGLQGDVMRAYGPCRIVLGESHCDGCCAEACVLIGHDEWIRTVAFTRTGCTPRGEFSPSACLLASADQNGCVRIWHIFADSTTTIETSGSLHLPQGVFGSDSVQGNDLVDDEDDAADASGAGAMSRPVVGGLSATAEALLELRTERLQLSGTVIGVRAEAVLTGHEDKVRCRV
jgi:WD40 repeat protein